MKYNITVLPGDGIGPEIINEAVAVLETIGQVFGHQFIFQEQLIGGAAIDKYGLPLPQVTLDSCLAGDAVLLGSVGGPSWDKLPVEIRPEKGLLALRSAMQVFANLRPVLLYPQLAAASPIKEGIIGKSLDIMIVRELTGGIYFGPREQQEAFAYDTEYYTKEEIVRVAEKAFAIAQKRSKKLTLVDKANVLASSLLWREVIGGLASQYPQVKVDYLYIDNAAMQLIVNPHRFDVILTANMFGDILSDEASVLTGSIGMLPSASLGYGGRGLYEPAHGSAPDIAGKNIANPLAAILSGALLLRHSLDLPKEALYLEKAVEAVLEMGYRTKDIFSEDCMKIGTREMGEQVRRFLLSDPA